MLGSVGEPLKNHVNTPQNCSLRAKTIGVLFTASNPSLGKIYPWRHLITGFSKLSLHANVARSFPGRIFKLTLPDVFLFCFVVTDSNVAY